MKIVEARLQDYSDVCPLFEALDNHQARLQPSRVRASIIPARSAEKYEWYISGDDRVMFLAVENEQIIGFTNLWIVDIKEEEMRVGRRYAHLDNIFVMPQFRRRRAATRLMERASEWSRNQHLSKIELQVFESNADAVELYANIGYQTYMRKMELGL